jgi:hypothetical protein
MRGRINSQSCLPYVPYVCVRAMCVWLLLLACGSLLADTTERTGTTIDEERRDGIIYTIGHGTYGIEDTDEEQVGVRVGEVEVGRALTASRQRIPTGAKPHFFIIGNASYNPHHHHHF